MPNFKVNGSSIVNENAREIGRVEFLESKYENLLRANIEQSAEKLEVFEDIDSELLGSRAAYERLKKAEVVDILMKIESLMRNASWL